MTELYPQPNQEARANSQESELATVTALRAIRQAIEDPELSHAQAAVIIAVILRADNKTGLAWAGYRSLARTCRVSTSTVGLALQRANKYLEEAGIGKQGARRYSVKAQRPEKRIDGESASTIEAQRIDHRRASAATIAHKLTPITDPSSNPSKSAAGKPPPDPRVREFIAWFAEAFEKARRVKYIVAGAKDGATVKRLLATLSPQELQAAALAMLADTWGKERASIGLLAGQINTWHGNKTGKGRAGFTAAPAGQSYNGLAKEFKQESGT